MSEANGPASASAAQGHERNAVERSGPAQGPRPSADHGADACGRPGPGSAEEERLTYTVDEAAALLGISRRHTWRQIAQGRIPVVRLGHRTLISRAALRAVLDAPGGRDGSATGRRSWASKRNAVERSDASAEGGQRDALLRVMT